MGGWLYMLQCRDGGLYVGTTRATLEQRVAERQVKGWRREKKLALVRGDVTRLPELSRRKQDMRNA